MKREHERQQGHNVEIGDHVYFDSAKGPICGVVRARGKHGCTVRCDKGKPHKVPWSKFLGHKSRSTQRYTVVDQGEDGMIVEDEKGQRRYLRNVLDAQDDEVMTKSLSDGRKVVLFMKAGGSIVNRPGLTRKQIVDRTGRKQTKWVRAQDEQPKDRQRAKPEVGSQAGYGTHNLEAGDTVRFRAGDYEGTGEIVGNPGADGAHVKDASGRVHQVRWSEITGHDDKGGAAKPDVANTVTGSQEPIPAESFAATEYAKSHDKADVTPEDILSNFPEDTADKIKAVQERLAGIEQTIDLYKKDGSYTEERQELHAKIFDEILSDERIAAATPAGGEAPTFIILGGRGGSGKSWFEGNVYDPEKAIVLDADHIKGLLPEYEGWNAAQIHEESGEIFDQLVNMSRALGLNVVLDKTMKTAKSAIADVQAFKDAGYRTEAHYMHLPRQEAAKRAVARFLGKTQRYVPVEVVLSNTTNEGAFDQVKGIVDNWSFRDNNVKQGEQPILISQSEDKKTTSNEELLTKSDKIIILKVRRKS